MKDKNIQYENQGLALSFDAVTGFANFPTGQTLQTACAVGDWRDLLLTVSGTGTVKLYGSAQELPPDFTAPSTITNSYVPISLVDYSLVGAVAYYPGATGAIVAGATMLVEADTNLLTWIGIHRSANTVDVKLTRTNAQ